MKQIAPESKEFLVFLFTDLREDLANQPGAQAPGYAGSETIARTRAICDALLSGLAEALGSRP